MSSNSCWMSNCVFFACSLLLNWPLIFWICWMCWMWSGQTSEVSTAIHQAEGAHPQRRCLGMAGPNRKVYLLTARVCLGHDGLTLWKQGAWLLTLVVSGPKSQLLKMVHYAWLCLGQHFVCSWLFRLRRDVLWHDSLMICPGRWFSHQIWEIWTDGWLFHESEVGTVLFWGSNSSEWERCLHPHCVHLHAISISTKP